MSPHFHDCARPSPADAVHRSLLALLIILGHAAAGCTTLVPHSSGTSAVGNGITEYSNPTFESRTAWPGWTFIGTATAFGAWKGYTSNIGLRWTGWERRKEVQPIGNAALGGLTGLASSMLLTLITGGDAPPVTSDNAGRWLDAMNDRLILLPVDTLHPGLVLPGIRGIARNADASFFVHSLNDVRLFLAVFPTSPHRDSVLSSAIPMLGRDSLIPFASLVHGLPAEPAAIDRYISTAATFDEALHLAERFPEHRDSAQWKAAQLVRTLGDARQFAAAFPGSPLVDAVGLHVRDRLQHDEIPEFMRLFPTVDGQAELRYRYMNTYTTVPEVIAAMRRHPEFRQEAERRAAMLAASTADYHAYLREFPEGAAAREMERRLRLESNTVNSGDDSDDSTDPETGQ
ncbi:MAG: hypothetical protein JST22_02805 [Bacteroidetes bacterium]|nr:hypothetical protein [Bacteroidota bacterium]